MKTSLLALSIVCAQSVFATPHRHAHNHMARHVKRDDENPVTWVTEWVSVTKTVEVTSTAWVTPSVPQASATIENKQDAPNLAIPTSSAEPVAFFEPLPSASIESTPLLLNDNPSQNVDKSPVQNEAPHNIVDASQANKEADLEKNVPESTVTESSSNFSNNKTAPLDHAVSTGPCSAGSPCSGDITYYDPGVGSGACGWQNTKDEPVVALPHEFMGAKSNGNPYCGKTVTIVHNGKTSTAKVVDKCMGCPGFSIDLSNSVFSQLEALSVGRTTAKWWIN